MRIIFAGTTRARIVLLAGLAALALMPTQAHAAGLLAQIQSMLSQYIPSSDESMSMLRQVFGDFVLNPFAQTATGSGLLAQMFGQFNMFIFTVAIIWFSYTAVSALMHTMHEGVVFGQRMSTVWLPVRVGFGAVSLVPMFGGWALCQALMMTGAALGIAGANALTQTAVNSAAGFGALVNGSASIKSSSQMLDVDQKLLDFVACVRSVNDQNSEQAAAGVGNASSSLAPTSSVSGNTLTFAFPSNLGTTGCGTIALTFSARSNAGIGSSFGFRIQGVDYAGIRTAAMAAHTSAMTELIRRAQTIVTGAGDATPGSAAYQQAVTQMKTGYIGAYAGLVDANLAALAASADARNAAVSDQLKQNMLNGGWATLGTWYQTFAEVNEAMNEMLDPKFVAVAGKTMESSRHVDLMDGIEAVGKQALGGQGAAQPSCVTATGNCSIGQFLMRGAINMAVGSSSTGNGQMINPIMAFKNLGDNAIVLAETMYVAKKVIDATPLGATIGKAAKGLSAVGGGGGPLGFITSIISDFSELIVPLGFILFVTAAMMAFYIPMIPFIQWFAALLNWFASIIESLVGSSLWALAHFDADGEGMGQRASYGYLYLFNNFARPIVLVFGFFVASAGINVLGTFLFKYFGQAVANAQGESLTGLLSIIAYLVIFVILGTTLVSSMFNLTLHMADRVIGFIGTGIQSSLGHDVENKVNSVFVNASRSGTGVLQQRAGASKGDGMATSVEKGVRAALGKSGAGGLGGVANVK